MIDGNIIIFDTETISIEKKFIYNVGYVIVSPDGKTLVERDFIIKQIYDNKPLFSTAYYADKREYIISNLKGRRSKKISWGECCRLMLKDIETYKVTDGFAYNVKFDVSAFSFTHLFFKNKRKPLDGLQLYDIMDYLKPITETEDYINFCQEHKFLTKTGKPRRTAEVLTAFIRNNYAYKEEHMALADARIETEILFRALRWLDGMSSR